MSGETFVRCYQYESCPSRDPRKEKQVREALTGPLQCDLNLERVANLGFFLIWGRQGATIDREGPILCLTFMHNSRSSDEHILCLLLAP